MGSKKWAAGFLFLIALLTAGFAVPLTIWIAVQTDSIARQQHVVRVEMEGSTCLALAYETMRGIQGVDRSVTGSGALGRATAGFTAARCATVTDNWAAVAHRLAVKGKTRERSRALAAAMAGVLNSIGDRTNLTYDPHPVVLDLGDALAYALPEVQRLMFDAATAPTRIEAAKLDATATERLGTAAYDIKAAIGLRPALGPMLAEPLLQTSAAAAAYSRALDAWEKGPAERQLHPGAVEAAMSAAVARTDRLIGLTESAINRELATQIGVLDEQLRFAWSLYAFGLASTFVVVWIIASAILRREKSALLQVKREASRLQAELARDRAEHEAGIKEARFQAIFAGSPMAIAITDAKGGIVESNDAYRLLVGSTLTDRSRRTLLYPLSVEPRHALQRIFTGLEDGEQGIGQVDLLLTNRDSTRTWCHAIVSIVRDASEAPAHRTVMFQDITDRKERERYYQYEATHDFLTGLPNRAFVVAALQDRLAAQFVSSPRFAVLFMDVDDFKTINDTLGHRAGDDCLKTVALRLASLMREVDVVTRYGGDEFVILLTDPASVRNAHDIAARISVAFQTPLAIADATVTLSLSVGIMVDRRDYASAEHVLRDADTAMYDEKRGGAKRVATIHRTPELVVPT